MILNTDNNLLISYEFSNLENLPDNDTNIVAFSSDLCFMSYNLEHAQHRLAATKDRLFMFSSIYLFRKTSPLVTEFNRLLQSLQEAGLINYWIRNYTDTRKTAANKHRTKLEMTSILVAFQFCGAMYAVSFVVFILGLVSVKFKRVKRIIDYITY